MSDEKHSPIAMGGRSGRSGISGMDTDELPVRVRKRRRIVRTTRKALVGLNEVRERLEHLAKGVAHNRTVGKGLQDRDKVTLKLVRAYKTQINNLRDELKEQLESDEQDYDSILGDIAQIQTFINSVNSFIASIGEKNPQAYYEDWLTYWIRQFVDKGENPRPFLLGEQNIYRALVNAINDLNRAGIEVEDEDENNRISSYYKKNLTVISEQLDKYP